MDVRILTALNQIADPYPLLAWVREAEPVSPVRDSPVPSWVLTRHADVRDALTDRRLSSDPASDIEPPDEQRAGHVSRTAFTESMFTTDPPAHTRLRRAVTPYMARQQVAKLWPFIEHTANSLIDDFHRGHDADAVEDFAAPLTILTICRMLGLPPQEHRNILEWSHALMTTQTNESTRFRSHEGGHALTDFLTGFIGGAKTQPGDGLINSLATAPAEDRLTDDEILTTSMLMLVAGHETSIALISTAIRHLLCDPWTAQTLRDRPGILPQAINEILRYDGPVTMTLHRIATADINHPDATIHTGDHVFLCLASANHDERRFPHADQIITDREPNPHLAFGHGIHRCPGATLALQEATIAINLLLHRAPNLSMAVPDSELRWRPSKLRCLEHLPINLTALAPEN